MLSSKTGLSLNMAGHYPGGRKNPDRAVRQPERATSFVYPKVRYLGPAHPDRSERKA
jgi:hypothetical protein